MTNYSNPRMHAVIENWPSGGKLVTATFEIEVNKNGERACRTTSGATKKLTYARKARIVDGDDGLTYIAELTTYGHIRIMCGNMRYEHEVVFDREPRYPKLLKLFEEKTS
jgi:hypothetical protein